MYSIHCFVMRRVGCNMRYLVLVKHYVMVAGSAGKVMVCYGYVIVSLWLCYGYVMLWLCYCYVMVSPESSY